MTDDKFPTTAVVAGAVGITGVVGIVYLGYKYFVGPGQAVLGEYKLMLEDIYKETKQFITDNSKRDPPVSGLLSWQEAMLNEKKKTLALLEPKVLQVLENAKLDPTAWFRELFLTIAEVLIAVVVVGAIAALIRDWWKKSGTQNLQSAESHSNLIYEMCTQEFAGLGQLNLASGLQTSIESMYAVYTQPALISAAVEYSTILSGLAAGTVEYLVYSQLLNFVQTEISATMGIAAQMYPFWTPF